MKILKKTKIVATVGPATASEKILEKMLKNGVNVLRLNFSHGDHKEHLDRIRHIQNASKKTEIPVSLLQDLSGPKIRTGDFYKDQVYIVQGKKYTFTTKKVLGDETQCYINYPHLPQEVKKGDAILLDDGKKSFTVIGTTRNTVECRIKVGGPLKNRRGVNIPNVDLKHIQALTPKDRKDLEFGMKQPIAYIALSFVRYPDDIIQLRRILDRNKCNAKIIAKIETTQAVENLQEIIDVSDGVMVARGDLAIEIPTQDVPLLQKKIIRACRQLGKPVIVATQMLASMVDSPQPSRAEVSDVANSILDGADAVMLSEETTIGKYPIPTIRMMTSIAQKTESIIVFRREKKKIERKDAVDSITYAITKTAHDVNAKIIVALTESDLTARMIARHKPQQPLIALTPNPHTLTTLPLVYGCYAFHIDPVLSMEEAIVTSKKLLLKERLVKRGDTILIAAGVPFGNKGGTNMMIVQYID